LEALYAHRAKLQRIASDAEREGDRNSLERARLLIRHCDLLIETAREKAARK
jgi:hypothetical protein